MGTNRIEPSGEGRLSDLAEILAMIRFSHTVFALPFALLAAVMAWTTPLPSPWNAAGPRFRILDVLGIVACMVCAHSAAMAFNRIVDRDLDAHNPRTAQRHLPAGRLELGRVKRFTLVSSLGFVAATALFLPNTWPLLLSLPVLGFLFAYSYAKRFTAAAHFFLGAALMLAPVCTWIALRGPVLRANPADILPAVWLGLAILCWVAGFDIIYACQDAAYDQQARLRSVPAALGIPTALRVAAACHATMLVFLATLPLLGQIGGPRLALGGIYWAGVAMVAILLVYEHALVRPDDLTRVNVAFFQVNAVVSVGLFLVTSLDLLL